jgi:hypothetical protein
MMHTDGNNSGPQREYDNRPQSRADHESVMARVSS